MYCFPTQYVFVTNCSTTVSSPTTHEVLATAVTAILRQTADVNTSNKLLKVFHSIQFNDQHRPLGVAVTLAIIVIKVTVDEYMHVSSF